jgi:hypothetical protein
MLSEVSQDQKYKSHMFFSYMEDRSNDKHIYKNKHDHIQKHVEHVCNCGILMELGEREKGKQNDRASVIYIRCKGRGYKDVFLKLLTSGWREAKG